MSDYEWRQILLKYNGRIVAVLGAIILFFIIYMLRWAAILFIILVVIGFLIGYTVDQKGGFKETKVGQLFYKWWRE
ncbi:MAG: hypothetical protein RLZ12_97 [Bacillota bacterium]|jgi:uncharacterized membrane protein